MTKPIIPNAAVETQISSFICHSSFRFPIWALGFGAWVLPATGVGSFSSGLLLDLLQLPNESLGPARHVAKLSHLLSFSIQDDDGWIALYAVLLLQRLIGLLQLLAL